MVRCKTSNLASYTSKLAVAVLIQIIPSSICVAASCTTRSRILYYLFGQSRVLAWARKRSRPRYRRENLQMMYCLRMNTSTNFLLFRFAASFQNLDHEYNFTERSSRSLTHFQTIQSQKLPIIQSISVRGALVSSREATLRHSRQDLINLCAHKQQDTYEVVNPYHSTINMYW